MDKVVEDLLNSTVNYEDFSFALNVPQIQPIHVATLVFYGLVFVLGVPGNALVVWVTAFGMPRTVNTILFLNLSLADLLCCLFLPILMVPLAHDDHWHFGAAACTLLKGMFHLLMYCSVLLLVVISVDRCMLVSLPIWCQNHRRPRVAVWACVGAWLLALFATVPELLYTRQVVFGDKKECLGRRSPVQSQVIVGFRLVFGFLLPFLAIVVSHATVYMRANRMAGRIRSKRTLKVIVAVVISFFFCWLPLHILDLLITMTRRNSLHRANINISHSLALCLAYFNSCINPILYVCLGRDFRTSMNRSLRSHFHFINDEPTCQQTTTAHNSKSSPMTGEMTDV
ncbi:hypothetical protein NHX12_008724 [Muraenolepis orangiensis]|uniref:G-protein coupled receptors family 1 profile domain-containing protein n=1 Tax=Muraenolepis orangiensis TaxID=630683 RepID=A0A9Q0DLA5_9TELE|nr:hypothetical protein NHX12_008724 [Muraenolepis orangiensis]